MGNIPGNNQRPGKAGAGEDCRYVELIRSGKQLVISHVNVPEAGADGVLRQLGEDLRHGAVQVHFDHLVTQLVLSDLEAEGGRRSKRGRQKSFPTKKTNIRSSHPFNHIIPQAETGLSHGQDKTNECALSLR